MDNFMTDSRASLGFVQSNLAHIEREVNSATYEDIFYQELVPVDTSAGEFDDSIVYYSDEMFGEADWINGNADDVPISDYSMADHRTLIHTAASGFSYGLVELGRAQKAGVQLTSKKALAARRAYEEMVQRVALTGDTSKNIKGLFNSTTVTAEAAVTGSWNTATADQIFDDINAGIQSIRSSTNNSILANTILLPQSRLTAMAKRIPDTGVPILEYVKKYNLYTMQTGNELDIRAVNGLEEAGVGDVKRMVAYRKSDDVLKMHIPMTHRFIAPQPVNLHVKVPGLFRFGGVDIRRTSEVRYIDGV
jgi:hypothetical protein